MGSSVEETQPRPVSSASIGLRTKFGDSRPDAPSTYGKRSASSPTRYASTKTAKTDHDVVNNQHGAEAKASAAEAFGREWVS